MPKVTYISHEGEVTEIELQEGWTVMQGATFNGIDGIIGECGGSCACATCHVYVDERYLDLLPPMQENEDEMLECTESERRANSRLGCQIKLTPELDGLVVRMPEAQD